MTRGTALAAATWLAAGISAAAAPPPDEDEDRLYPFPPGEHAALTRQTCSACHDGSLVANRRYDAESARRYFRLMVGDPDSELGRKVIAYLTTVLGEDP